MLKKIKILEIYNLAASAEQFVGDRFSYFQKHGNYEMHLIASPNATVYDFAKKESIHYFPVELERHTSLLKDIKALCAIIKYIKREKIDILVTSNAKATLLGQIAGRLANVPYSVGMVHGNLYSTSKGLMRKLLWIEDRFVSSLSDINICVSKSLMKYRNDTKIDSPVKQVVVGEGTCAGVDALHQFNPNNINISILNGIRTDLGISDSDFVIGFCGRLVRDKGIIELADAFKAICEKYPEKSLKLLVIGKKESWDAIPESTMSILSNSSNIIFTGFVQYSKIQYYYKLMDLFILPSYREGFPTVVLEASSMAVPVIVSKSTGCIDSIVNGVTGLYADITSESISSSIEQMLDTNFREKLGGNGRKWILENYEHKIVIGNLLAFFKTIKIKDK